MWYGNICITRCCACNMLTWYGKELQAQVQRAGRVLQVQDLGAWREPGRLERRSKPALMTPGLGAGAFSLTNMGLNQQKREERGDYGGHAFCAKHLGRSVPSTP